MSYFPRLMTSKELEELQAEYRLANQVRNGIVFEGEENNESESDT